MPARIGLADQLAADAQMEAGSRRQASRTPKHVCPDRDVCPPGPSRAPTPYLWLLDPSAIQGQNDPPATYATSPSALQPLPLVPAWRRYRTTAFWPNPVPPRFARAG